MKFLFNLGIVSVADAKYSLLSLVELEGRCASRTLVMKINYGEEDPSLI